MEGNLCTRPVLSGFCPVSGCSKDSSKPLSSQFLCALCLPQRPHVFLLSDAHTLCSSCIAGHAAWEGFFGRQDPQCPVSISSTQLNFGSCARLSPANHQTLTVTNTSASARVTVFLSVPPWQGPGLQSPPQQVFQVCCKPLQLYLDELQSWALYRGAA